MRASAAEAKVLPDVKGFVKSAGSRPNSRARIFLASLTEVRFEKKPPRIVKIILLECTGVVRAAQAF